MSSNGNITKDGQPTGNYIDGLVSVVMPMHNSERFLREAVESVIAQTYANWELFIIDDASNDNSLAIAKEYEAQDKRIHVLQNETPIGRPSAPRNIGIKAARGRFISFLDSDDFYFPKKIEQQLPLFEEEKVAIVFSNYEKVSEQGERRNRIVKAPEYADYDFLLKGNVIGNLTGMYDRSKTGTVFIEDRHHEDYVMWLSILKRGFVAKNTQTVNGGYRVRTSSVSAHKFETAKWQWHIYRHVENLSLIRSVCCFAFYAVKAMKKRFI